ncbi:MAG: flagellin [Campylobacterota bacterium]|nr:flagellin [Campylobacterota bacterium]
MNIDNSLSNSHYMTQNQNNTDKVLGMIASGHQNRLDDVASASIATLMQSQISSMGQGLMNLNDGISMMQIADGVTSGLSENADKLSAMSVRYNNAALNNSDRAALQKEFTAISSSMQESIDSTSYNGNKLFGSEGNIETSQGTLSASIGTLDASSLDITSLESIQAFQKQLASVQSDIGSNTNAMTSSINSLQQALINTSSAQSQLSDTDIAQAVSQFQQNDLKIELATLVQVHKMDTAQQQMSRLLG